MPTRNSYKNSYRNSYNRNNQNNYSQDNYNSNNYDNTYNNYNSYNQNNYTNTSSAYDYSYDNSYDNYNNEYSNSYDVQQDDYLTEIKVSSSPKSRVLKRRKKRVAYVHLNEKITFFSKEALIIIATVFLGSMAIIFGNSTTTSKKVDITSIRNQVATLSKDNDTLKAEIDQSYDLVEIEYIATTQLGMSKPKSHQIVYINAEVDSYVKQYEEEKPTSIESTFFESFKSSLINIFTVN